MSFGRPVRYLQLDPAKVRACNTEEAADQTTRQEREWNFGVAEGNAVYRGRMHNLICDNCHSHVARCLDVMKYDGSSSWNMLKIGAWIALFGSFVSVRRTIQAYLPFTVLVILIFIVKYVL